MSAHSDKTSIGTLYERLAGNYLHQRGHRLMAANFRCRLGEIDLITQDPQGYLVFVEVRYRASERFCGALASVSTKKQTRLRRAAQTYLAANPRFHSRRCRFDVIAISDSSDSKAENNINWIKSAFY